MPMSSSEVAEIKNLFKKKNIFYFIEHRVEPHRQSFPFLLATERLSNCTSETTHTVIVSAQEDLN